MITYFPYSVRRTCEYLNLVKSIKADQDDVPTPDEHVRANRQLYEEQSDSQQQTCEREGQQVKFESRGS